MSNNNESKSRLALGIFLIAGPILASAAKLAGLGPPTSDTGFSQGGQIGYWIGTAVSILIGITLIVKHSQAKNGND